MTVKIDGPRPQPPPAPKPPPPPAPKPKLPDLFTKGVKALVDLAAAAPKPPMMLDPKQVVDLVNKAKNGIGGIIDQLKGIAANYDPQLAATAGVEGVILTGTTWMEQNLPILGPVSKVVDRLLNHPPAPVAWPDPPPAASANPPLTTGVVKGPDGNPTTPAYQSTDNVPLFGPNGPQLPGDVNQGQLGDCYFMASMAGLTPAQVNDMVKDNHDGTYTVRLYDVDSSGTSKPVFVTVNGDLPNPAAANYNEQTGKWAAIIEKAYAVQTGSYDVASGDKNPKFFAAPTVLTGRPTVAYVLSVDGHLTSSPDVIFERLTKAAADGRPAFAGFYGTPHDGVLADHAYTVEGTRVDPQTGERYVTLRNPWGSTEPMGSDGKPLDGKDDGVFEMKLEDFMKTYQAVAVAGG